MERRSKTIVRKGNVYHFIVAEKNYTAFIWQSGNQFCGRVEGNPQVAECEGRTAFAVRDALAQLLAQTPAK
jgi:hypothetical protein